MPHTDFLLDDADFAEMSTGHFVAPEDDVDMWSDRSSMGKRRVGVIDNGVGRYADYAVAQSAAATQANINRGWKVFISIATVLVIIGALNWLVVGSTGLSNQNAAFDLFKPTLGQLWAPLPYIVYLVVGLAGIVLIWAAIVRSMRRSRAKQFTREETIYY